MNASNKAKHSCELEEKNVVPAARKSIFDKSDYKLIQIEFINILYIEGLKDYVKFYLEGNEKSGPFADENEGIGRKPSR